jgi:hypothetical protein
MELGTVRALEVGVFNNGNGSISSPQNMVVRHDRSGLPELSEAGNDPWTIELPGQDTIEPHA